MQFSDIPGNRADEVKIVRTTPTFDCGGRCPIKLHVRDNKILRVEGADINPDQQ